VEVRIYFTICISVQYPWQSIRIRIRVRSNKEIAIRILSVSVKIADIRKISIRGYISAHLWRSWSGPQGQHWHSPSVTTVTVSQDGCHAINYEKQVTGTTGAGFLRDNYSMRQSRRLSRD